MREGGSSSYCEVTQVLFVEMEIPGNPAQTPRHLASFPQKRILFFSGVIFA